MDSEHNPIQPNGEELLPEAPSVPIRQRLLTPRDIGSKVPAPILWTTLAIGWVVAFGEFGANAMGYSWDWTPKLSVEAQISHRPSSSIGTEFRITNTGRVKLSNLHFSCFIDMQPNGYSRIALNDGSKETAGYDLVAGDDIQKDCGSSFLTISPPATTLDLQITYDWFWGHADHPFTKHFAIRHGEDGVYYAVPDHRPIRASTTPIQKFPMRQPLIAGCSPSIVRLRC